MAAPDDSKSRLVLFFNELKVIRRLFADSLDAERVFAEFDVRVGGRFRFDNPSKRNVRDVVALAIGAFVQMPRHIGFDTRTAIQNLENFASVPRRNAKIRIIGSDVDEGRKARSGTVKRF